MTDELRQLYSECGIEDYEMRGFDIAFTRYVDLMEECYVLTSNDICDELAIVGRWRETMWDIYRIILECPEIWW